MNALQDATSALVLDPSSVKAAFRRAGTLLQLKMFAEALVACDHGLELSPGDESLLRTAAASSVSESPQVVNAFAEGKEVIPLS